jgi:uncharacterized membrane protein HdeD (DUF308 family)
MKIKLIICLILAASLSVPLYFLLQGAEADFGEKITNSYQAIFFIIVGCFSIFLAFSEKYRKEHKFNKLMLIVGIVTFFAGTAMVLIISHA